MDDTFLYLEVARNWARHGFPSLDGVTPTNGIQPLWGAMVAAMAAVVRDGALLLRVVCLLCALLNALTGLVLLRLGTLLGGRGAGALAAALWASVLFIPASISGMEAPLHGFVFACMALVVLQMLRASPESLGAAQGLCAGLLLAANALCRLDSAIVSAIVGTPLLVRLAAAGRVRRAALIAAVPIVVLGIYLAANQAFFGSPLPISGQVKIFYVEQSREALGTGIVGTAVRTFGTIVSRCYRLTSGQDPAAPIGAQLGSSRLISRLVGLGAIVGLVLAGRRRRIPGFLGLLAAATLAHALIVAALLERFAANDLWYYQPLRAVLALLAGFGLAQAAGLAERRTLRALLLAAGLAAFANPVFWGVAAMRDKDPSHLYVRRIEAARWIASAKEIEPGAGIGSWNAGQLAYFADPRAIINLDGLVQSQPFLDEVLRTGDWRGYFLARKIRYLVDFNGVDSTQTYRLSYDPATSFRGIVPLDRARVVRHFGMIVVLDIGRWLDAGAAPGPRGARVRPDDGSP